MIDRFSGDHFFLSNMWPVNVLMDDKFYPSVEHAYQASKTINPYVREVVAKCATPYSAKKFARTYERRADWHQVKLQVMEDLLRLKFAVPAMLAMLRDTGSEELVEGNDWGDRFWGKVDGEGENHLGKLLMKIRDEKR